MRFFPRPSVPHDPLDEVEPLSPNYCPDRASAGRSVHLPSPVTADNMARRFTLCKFCHTPLRWVGYVTWGEWIVDEQVIEEQP